MGNGVHTKFSIWLIFNLLEQMTFNRRPIVFEIFFFKICRSKRIIRKFLKKGQNYGAKAPTRGNAKLTSLQRGKICNEALRISYLLDKSVTNSLRKHSEYVIFSRSRIN